MTGKQPCTRQDLDRRVRRLAIDEMETAQQAVKTLTAAVQTLTALWLEERQAGPSDEANALKKELEEAEAKLDKAKKELRDAEQKYEQAKASAQAGPAQAGGFCTSALQLLRLQRSRMVTVCFLGLFS